MTLSMMRGEAGHQGKEVAKLVHWLRTELKPDIVHLSNALLSGMARSIRTQLGVPVVASLAGEDIFLEQLPEPHHSQTLAEMRTRCRELDRIVAPHQYTADFMADYLQLPRDRITVVRPGINVAAHDAVTTGEGEVDDDETNDANRPRRIGFLGRICPEKGLHLLAEAMKILAHDNTAPHFEVHAAGYLGQLDRPYLADIEQRLADARLADRFHYHGEVDLAGKVALLRASDVMTLPTVYRETKGLPVLEAWLHGRPVVVPDHGVFPEMIAATGGGRLCRPDDAESLAAELRALLLDESTAGQMGRKAQEEARRVFTSDRMATEVRDVYTALLAEDRAPMDNQQRSTER